MVLAVEHASHLWSEGEALLMRLYGGRGDAVGASAAWRTLAERQTDGIKRAEAMLNLATALEHLGEEGVDKAIEISVRWVAKLGAGHPDLFGANLMAAQRLAARAARLRSREDATSALDFLDAALSTRPRSAPTEHLVAVIALYGRVVPEARRFNRLRKVRRLFDEVLTRSPTAAQALTAHGAMAAAYEAHWKTRSDRASFGEALRLTERAERWAGQAGSDAEPMRAAVLQQQAILLLHRWDSSGSARDHERALRLLRDASGSDERRPTLLNSLALALLDGPGAGPASSVLRSARAIIDEGLSLASDPTSVAHLRWTSGIWHLRSFQHDGRAAHLDLAIADLERASALDAALGPEFLLARSHAHHDRFRHGRDASDVEHAVAFAEGALGLVAEHDPGRWSTEVTAANAYQERALNGPSAFDAGDADRATSLLEAAMSRLSRDDVRRARLASSTLGAYLERYMSVGCQGSLAEASRLARMLPRRASEAGGLEPIVAVNLAALHALSSAPGVDDEWTPVLRRLAMMASDDEATWLAAANWMHRSARVAEWGDVVEAHALLEARCVDRLDAARTMTERATTLRREQNFAGVAALALVRMGRPVEAATLLDRSQGRLLGLRAGPSSGSDVWEAYDAVVHLGTTPYGGFAIVTARSGSTGLSFASVAALERREQGGAPAARTMEDLGRVLEATFGPDVPRRALIVPTGRLSAIPWAAVPVHGEPLVTRCAVSVLPSALAHRARRARGADRVLVVEVGQPPDHRPLAHVDGETRALLRLDPDAVVLKDGDATRENVAKVLAAIDVAHFACHGVAELGRPLDSHLVLHGGERLTVRDVAEAGRLPPWLVVLSACRTAIHAGDLPDEFASMAVAFLAAGAQSVVGTLWDVKDAAALLFSKRFYHHLSAGCTSPEAVRQAQVWMLRTPDGEKLTWLEATGPVESEADGRLRRNLGADPERVSFARTAYWAPFVCCGG